MLKKRLMGAVFVAGRARFHPPNGWFDGWRGCAARRAKDRADLGFYSEHQRAAFKNWTETADLREPLGKRQGIEERELLQEDGNEGDPRK